MKTLFAAFIFLSAIAACSDSDDVADKCKEQCPEVCPGAPARTPAQITNCETECDELQARAETRDCESEQAALYDCAAENQCKSTFVADCRTQSDALNTCNADYCRSHTSDPDC